jgi:Helix-turn-helix domain
LGVEGDEVSSQTEIILAALQRGEAISKLDAFRMGAGLSINSRISDIRKLGYLVECAVETREGRKVWVYRLLGPVQRSLFEGAESGTCGSTVSAVGGESTSLPL